MKKVLAASITAAAMLLHSAGNQARGR